MSTNVYALFDRWARAKPSAPFITDEDGGVTTYGAFERLTARIAGELRRAGVAPAQRVANALPKSVLALAAHFACLRSGVVSVPLNPDAPAAETMRLLLDAQCRGVVCDGSFPITAEDLPGGMARLNLAAQGKDGLPDAAGEPPADAGFAELEAAAVAAIVYTSGSSGRPKGVVLTHGGLRENVRLLAPVVACDERDVMLHALPLFHSHGLTLAINCVVEAGGQFILLSRFRAAQAAEAMARATIFTGVPTMYARLANEPAFTADACAGMRLFMCSSARLAPSIALPFREKTGRDMLEIYGLTETGTIATARRNSAHDGGLRLLAGTRIRIESDEEQSGGSRIGRLFVCKPHMAAGYWRDGAATPLPRVDGYYDTGDIASVDAGGAFEIVGRSGDVINSGGNKIFPREIELAVCASADVRECVVFGAPHPDLGEMAVAAVVLAPGSTPEAVAAFVQQKLERSKQPRAYWFLDTLPLSPAGKPDIRALRQAYQDGAA